MRPDGPVWLWECSGADCGTEAEPTLPDAYDSALGHLRTAHRPIVSARLMPRQGAYRVWRVTLGPYELGHVCEYPILDYYVYGPVRKSVFPHDEPWFCYSPRLHMSTDISMAVHEPMGYHGCDDKWLTSTGGYSLVVDGGEAVMVGASARTGAGGGDPARLNDVQERLKEPGE